MKDESLWAEGVLGKQVEMFLASDLGQAMVGLAEQEVGEALEEFRHADPCNHISIQKIQNKIWRAEQFKSWLAELIIAGQQATKTLEMQKLDDQS